MQNYLNESLNSGIIHPSTSSLGAESFLLIKRIKPYAPAMTIVALMP